MINAWNLLWIVPAMALITAIILAVLSANRLGDK